MLLLETPKCTVKHLPEVPCLLSVWNGFVPDEVYKETVEAHFGIAQGLGVCNWIFDIRELRVIPVPAQIWAQEVWIPRAVQAGIYKNIALVEPKDYYAELSSEFISEAQSGLVNERRFASVEEAKEWLVSLR